MQVLNCKQHCSVELASTAGRDKPFEDFLPSHFNYLQFSYYNSECNVFSYDRIKASLYTDVQKRSGGQLQSNHGKKLLIDMKRLV